MTPTRQRLENRRRLLRWFPGAAKPARYEWQDSCREWQATSGKPSTETVTPQIEALRKADRKLRAKLGLPEIDWGRQS